MNSITVAIASLVGHLTGCSNQSLRPLGSLLQCSFGYTKPYAGYNARSPQVLSGIHEWLRVILRYLIVAMFILFSASCTSTNREHTYTTAENIFYFDSLSEEYFGVSLVALAWLANWKPHSYLPLSYLKQSGIEKALHELQDAGLIEIQEHDGLPDGTENGTVHISVVPKGHKAGCCAYSNIGLKGCLTLC